MTVLTTFFLTILSVLLASSAAPLRIHCPDTILSSNGDVTIPVLADIPDGLPIDTIQLVADYDEGLFASVVMESSAEFDLPGINQTYTDPTNGDMLAFSAARSGNRLPIENSTVTVANITFTRHPAVCLEPASALLTFKNEGAVNTGTVAYRIGAIIAVETEACLLRSADILPTCDAPEAIQLTQQSTSHPAPILFVALCLLLIVQHTYRLTLRQP